MNDKHRIHGVSALVLLGFVAWCSRAHATDFHVLELHAGQELHLDGASHGSYGIGYTFDAFVTTPSLQGFEVGVRADLLQCPQCEHELDGGAVVVPILVSFSKADLASVTGYVGLAPGGGYSRSIEAAFAEIELQAALQFRTIYDGLWIRPIIYAGAGGAYDGYTSVGVRIAIGFSPNHGVRPDRDGPQPPPDDHPTSCDPPIRAELAAGEDVWLVPRCFRADLQVELDGTPVAIEDRAGDLLVHVGHAAAGTTQQLRLIIGGGAFRTALTRR